MTMDAYRYESEIRDSMDLERLKSLARNMEEDIKKLEALRPALIARADHITRFIVHKYRVELFYYDSKKPWFYTPAYKTESGEYKKNYSAGERKGAHFRIRIDHRIYEGGKKIKEEYDEYRSLAFSPKQKEEALEYIHSLAKEYGLELLERDEMIKINPEIKNYSLVLGSLWEA